MSGLTQWQLDAIQTAERVSSVLSVMGCIFVILTYSYFKAFHKPINRLVFYASFGNLFTNVATIISRSGIAAGVTSPLCQFQGFIIQMFMPADSLWTLAMALNVYLTFFHRYSGEQLKALEWRYLVFCYGVPFVPAIVFVFVSTAGRGHIFGSAVLWCWITVDWNALRIITFYGPVWVVLIITTGIYIAVGKVVNGNRKRFRELTSQTAGSASMPELPRPTLRTETEIHITTTNAPSSSDSNNRPFDLEGSDRMVPYAVKIESTPPTRAERRRQRREQREESSADRAAWAYLKCAMLFFFALLITWVPATANRVATLINPDLASFGLNFTEALLLPLQGFWNATIYITTSMSVCREIFRLPRHTDAPFVELDDVPAPHGSTSASSSETLSRPKKAIVRTMPTTEELEEYERLAAKMNVRGDNKV